MAKFELVIHRVSGPRGDNDIEYLYKKFDEQELPRVGEILFRDEVSQREVVVEKIHHHLLDDEPRVVVETTCSDEFWDVLVESQELRLHQVEF